MGQLFSALITVVIGAGLAAAYFYAANKILDLIWPPRGPAKQAAHNQKISATIRPWLFLGPAILFLGLYLVYPALNSLLLSFYGRSGVKFVGISNYVWALNDQQFKESVVNNISG